MDGFGAHGRPEEDSAPFRQLRAAVTVDQSILARCGLAVVLDLSWGGLPNLDEGGSLRIDWALLWPDHSWFSSLVWVSAAARAMSVARISMARVLGSFYIVSHT